MSRIEELINIFETKANDPKQAIIDEMKRTGKKAVGCFPIYSPEEIVYAAGALPVGMWGGQTEIKLADKYLQSFCCSIMRANLELGMRGAYDFLSAIIIPLYCDTLKCIGEDWKVAVTKVPEIEMVYPQNRKIEAGRLYMVEEFKRVAGELEKALGVTITEEALLESLKVYDTYREAMQKFTKLVGKYPNTLNAVTRHLIIKASYFTDKKDYTDMINELCAELEKLPAEDFDGTKVVITGLLAEPVEFLEAFKDNNIAIVADDLAQESRQFRTLNGSEGTSYERMADRIARQDGCAFLYDDDKSRGQMLIDMTKECEADGIVVCMLKFCDPEEFDYPIYKKEIEAAQIPMLYVEIDQQMDSVEQVRTRIQSFGEMLA